MASASEKGVAVDTAQESRTHFWANDGDTSMASFDKDIASGIVPDHAHELDEATESKVVRKIDLYLIPWMWLGYGFVYYDKVR